MPKRTAQATWNGNLKDGKGVISTESGLLKDVNYSFAKRFEDEKGTNPEELLGAAHSACYSMALSHGISSEGYTVKSVTTSDVVHLEKVADGFAVTKIEVNCVAEIAGIDDKTFQKFANDTLKGCPIGRAVTGVEYVLNAKLK